MYELHKAGIDMEKTTINTNSGIVCWDMSDSGIFILSEYIKYVDEETNNNNIQLIFTEHCLKCFRCVHSPNLEK